MRNEGVAIDVGRAPGLWRVAQTGALLVTVALIALLFIAPRPTLGWTWNLVVPILPATFLISPAIWRNVCPLATLNELPDWLGKGNRLPGVALASGAVAGAAAVLLIPVRRIVFNTNGEVLGAVLIVLALVALGLGLAYQARSGFCNGICPILPVERLYGQHPLVDIRGSRCASCTFCTPAGCIDLARDKAVVQMLGRSRHSLKWLTSPMGAFAASFPGVIIAYFTSTDATSFTLSPIATTLLFAAISYAVVSLVALAVRLKGSLALTLLGATSFGLYYWYAAPGIAEQIGTGAAVRDGIRLVAAGLLVVWLVRARGVIQARTA